MHETVSQTEAITLLNMRKPGQYMTNCFSHPDDNPSLSLKVEESGKILWYCFASCSQEKVKSALIDAGMEWKGWGGY